MVEHLKPYQWKPGQSGNPNGPKRRRKLATILRELMEAQTSDGRNVGDAFVAAIVEHAVRDGNPALIKEILDRHDGKLVDKAKVRQSGGHTIRVEYGDDDDPAPEAAPGPA